MMSTQTNRRDFLKTTTVTTSGLVLGVVLPGTVAETMAAGTLHTPNAWVHIADDNSITLISARSEMGQGVYTSMPMLIAEELNIDVTKIKVAAGAPNAVYVNALLGAMITGGSHQFVKATKNCVSLAHKCAKCWLALLLLSGAFLPAQSKLTTVC